MDGQNAANTDRLRDHWKALSTIGLGGALLLAGAIYVINTYSPHQIISVLVPVLIVAAVLREGILFALKALGYSLAVWPAAIILVLLGGFVGHGFGAIIGLLLAAGLG